MVATAGTLTVPRPVATHLHLCADTVVTRFTSTLIIQTCSCKVTGDLSKPFTLLLNVPLLNTPKVPHNIYCARWCLGDNGTVALAGVPDSKDTRIDVISMHWIDIVVNVKFSENGPDLLNIVNLMKIHSVIEVS